MALDITGFRARRKASRAQEPGSVAAAPAAEKVPLGHRLGQWLTENPKSIRNGIIGALGIAVVIVLFLVLRAAAKDEHSRKLHLALEKYEQIKILPKGEARSLQMKEFGLSLKGVCEQTLSTVESAAACLSAGNAFLEARDFGTAAALFGRAASAYDSEAMVSVARFMQAQAYESNREFDKALAAYKELEPAYAIAKKSEMITFHEGRMFYYMGKFDEAEEKFVKISREGEGKDFAAPSRNYISILNAERAAKK